MYFLCFYMSKAEKKQKKLYHQCCDWVSVVISWLWNCCLEELLHSFALSESAAVKPDMPPACVGGTSVA